jgi:aspartate racemase
MPTARKRLLVTRGAEAVILGCTEFGTLVRAEDSAVPLIDTTLIHAEAAVDLAQSEQPAVEGQL